MDKLIQLAEHINNIWSLCAFGLACLLQLLYMSYRRRGATRVPPGAFITLVLLIAIPVASVTLVTLRIPGVYRVRVTVLDASGIPVDNPKLWSSLGGEQKSVVMGSEFDIPATEIPQNRTISVFASDGRGTEFGRIVIQLTNDFHPSVSIKLAPAPDANISGVVIDDETKDGVPEASVAVVGHQSVSTDKEGNFSLATDKSAGSQVSLRVTRKGYKPSETFSLAGSTSEHLYIQREKH